MHKRQHFRGKATARKRRKLLTVHELIFTLDLFNLWEIILHPSHHIILLQFSALPSTSLSPPYPSPPPSTSLSPHHIHHASNLFLSPSPPSPSLPWNQKLSIIWKKSHWNWYKLCNSNIYKSWESFKASSREKNCTIIYNLHPHHISIITMKIEKLSITTYEKN